MATMILLPTSTSGHTSHWVANTGTHEDALDDDNGDTSYVACSGAFRRLDLGFADPSVAEGDIASIDSVRFLSSGRSTHRTTGSAVTVSFIDPSGNVLETVTYDPHVSSHETINGTPRSTSDGAGGTDWTYDNLEDLSMRLTKSGTIEVYLSYFVMEVTYTEAVSADNATFFGANF